MNNKNMRNVSMIISVLLMIILTTVGIVSAMDDNSLNELNRLRDAGRHYEIISIKGNMYSPEIMYVAQGSIVFLYNEDSVVHYVKFSNNDNGYYDMLPGTILGFCCAPSENPIGSTTEYQDRDYSNMKGKVVITEENIPVPTSTVYVTPVQTYIADPNGFLSVTTNPVSGNILLNGYYQGTGSWSYSVGTERSITISFGDVSGYITPSSQTVYVNAGQTTYVTGTYIPVQTARPAYTERPRPISTPRPEPTTYVATPSSVQASSSGLGCWNSYQGFGVCAGDRGARLAIGVIGGIGKGIWDIFSSS
jgi:hypothetical protein